MLEDPGVDATKLLDKAQVAADRGNYDYAIDLYLQLLDIQPENLDARRLLREVEVRKFQADGVTSSNPVAWIKGIGPLISTVILTTLGKHEKGMAAAEAFLKNDPYNRTVLIMLARAAEKGDFLETAIQVLEDVRQRLDSNAKPKARVGLLRKLGDIYDRAEKLKDASRCFEEILQYLPNDREADARVRNIAARRSMTEGGWEKAVERGTGGYREVLKSKEKSADLEQAHRDIRTTSDVEDAIRRVKADLEQDPENTRYLLQLGDYYRTLKDWDTARATYLKAQELDPTNFLIAQRLGDLKLLEMDVEIEQLRDDPAQAEKVKELQEKRGALALEEYQKRVRARPQDLPTRYELGNILFRMKRYKDASVQFQQSARDPKTRRPSLYLLGICFRRQNLVDLAIEQFEKAAAGASLVDPQVKDILYALGEAHESQGRNDKALEAYKRIFEVDINFKDVSARIENLYRQIGTQE
jgi:tetratricopeptide (TPR) repeat protein